MLLPLFDLSFLNDSRLHVMLQVALIFYQKDGQGVRTRDNFALIQGKCVFAVCFD